MNGFLLRFLWYILYFFHIENNGVIQKGSGKRILVFFLGLLFILVSLWRSSWAIWLCISCLFLLYDLFFDEEGVQNQWLSVLLPGIALAVVSFFPEEGQFLANGFLLLFFFGMSAFRRGYLRLWNGAALCMIFGLFSCFIRLTLEGRAVTEPDALRFSVIWGSILAEYLIFVLLEGTFQSYQRGFAFQSERFQKEVLSHQYEEIRMIYKDMRGWRHDYHNHLQVLKAQLALGKLPEALGYLDELEESLNRVDVYMKSGNQMADAILNGKLSLAGEREILVNCKARLPEELPVADVDLCVILGNLLDNALEACEQIPPDKRFLRIYMAVNKKQLYISIQNSAKEELNFKEQHYISTKRGNHGLGMKRVQAAVEKYQGFLRLANEPGVFAAEVTMPLEGFCGS